MGQWHEVNRGGGILCLALRALHTGSSGAQRAQSEFKAKPQPAGGYILHTRFFVCASARIK